MILLFVYLALMITGNLIAYGVGLIVEKHAPSASLPAFLFMYFMSLGLSWLIAVRLTRPKTAPKTASKTA